MAIHWHTCKHSLQWLHSTEIALLFIKESNDHTEGGTSICKICLLYVSFSWWLWCKGQYEQRREFMWAKEKHYEHKTWYLKQKIATGVCFPRMQQTSKHFKWLFAIQGCHGNAKLPSKVARIFRPMITRRKSAIRARACACPRACVKRGRSPAL